MKYAGPGELSRFLVPGALLELAMSLSTENMPKFQTPRRKARVNIICIFPYHLVLGIHSYQGLVGILIKLEFPDASQVSLASRALRINSRPTVITLNCTQVPTCQGSRRMQPS